jgi:hypothetical protein
MQRLSTGLIGLLLLGACGTETEAPPAISDASGDTSVDPVAVASVEENPLKNAYFGDTHIHTVLSFDAFLFGTQRTPDDAYEFAKGAGIEHVRGFEMKMKKPLDFLAVSDHAFYLGMMREVAKTEGPYSEHPVAEAVRGATSAAGGSRGFGAVLGHMRTRDRSLPDDLDDRAVARSAWQEIIEAAERHNDPGNFTAFIGYEYTSSGPENQNLHRNVIFRGSAVPEQPWSRLDSTNPETLWSWMDKNRDAGMDALAIPHNMNGSDGWMFPENNWAGDPIDRAWAEQRMRNEPIVENSQVKGTSDTHPMLSPNDEWADFEIMPLRIASQLQSRPPGSYVRDALLRGIAMEEKSGFNPYKVGVIAASDTHNAAGSFEEDNYWSKTGYLDTPAYRRGSVPLPQPAADGSKYANGASKYWGASGLAGVWAESNTREALFQAMRRKETFSTSGPHIKVRFFGGYEFDESLLSTQDSIAQAYAKGVPMGSDLTRSDDAVPTFYLWASRDPDTHPLQRLQIIKGWVDNGTPHEAVIDVACADGLAVDPATLRCPDNGTQVDLSDCSVTPNKGDSELAAVWTDADFNPEAHAFYYVRVLENPSCRWSTYDAIRAGVDPRPDMHATIQDRAWSSPIWYAP